ncbi:hypothetical protein C8Q70DRAFT_1049168 [Cubamyces menziesii]|uniref:Uncharacterized protein n=1 Tax=Trametes cubensis TaxID=1111947 RepID=A0AAD7TRX1_9APHY|nr:hypothetical protein C8Q70DRAFT_1049168 [Cubamyces menziesii]KAJ8475415.1 hypothetical protein ONZ51_g6575 [Trametes cubensis]
MGSAASKPARKLARAPPAWAGARTPNVGEQAPTRPAMPRASETKNDAIERDSKDPDFLANLSKLGQVKVDHHMQTIRPAASQAQQLFQTRLQSEEQARSARPPRNHLVASSLLELLEERKYATRPQELAEIAKKYDMDVEKLERLARHVNSVSVQADSVRRWVDEEGVDRVTMLATWMNPQIQEDRPLVGSSR